MMVGVTFAAGLALVAGLQAPGWPGIIAALVLAGALFFAVPRLRATGIAPRRPRGGQALLLGGIAVLVVWTAGATLALVSLPADALPASGERVAEVETNVNGMVAAIELLGGGGQDEGPHPGAAFPIAGPEDAPITEESAQANAEAMEAARAAEPTVAPATATTTPTATPTEAVTPTSTSTATPTSAPATPTPAASTATPSATAAAPAPLSQPRITSGPGGGPLDTAGVNLYNCSDFTSWEQAVAVFRASGSGDVNQLDTDLNGIPCEELKAAELAGS